MLKKLINFICDIYLYKMPMFVICSPKMHKVKGYETRQILNNIKIGDIVLRNFDGYLSSFFIPGFWSHAGIYIGDNMIAHAVKEGVVKEDILDFCRTDQIALLRLKEHYIINEEHVLKQVEDNLNNKTEYDYEFKDDNDKVYCTEFVNICLDNIFDNDYKPKITRCALRFRILLPDSIFDSDKVDKIFVYKH